MSDVPRSGEAIKRMMNASQSLRDLVAKDPKVLDAITDEVTRYYPTPAYVGDRTIYRGVVVALGAVAIIAIAGAVGMAWAGQSQLPDAVTALGSAAVGALAGLLGPALAKK